MLMHLGLYSLASLCCRWVDLCGYSVCSSSGLVVLMKSFDRTYSPCNVLKCTCTIMPYANSRSVDPKQSRSLADTPESHTVLQTPKSHTSCRHKQVMCPLFRKVGSQTLHLVGLVGVQNRSLRLVLCWSRQRYNVQSFTMLHITQRQKLQQHVVPAVNSMPPAVLCILITHQ